jgi:penicillin amidase
MEALAQRGRITTADLWRVNREAAFEDGRWHDYVPLLERAHASGAARPAVGTPEGIALSQISAWDGQRTATQEDDGTWRYDDAATTIFDAWIQQLQRTVLADDLTDEFYDGESALGPRFAPAHYHLYSTILLKILLGEQAPLDAEYDWLNGTSAGEVIRSTFAAAVAELDEQYEGTPDTWRGPAVLTTYQSLGLLGVEPHPFMNRGTYNQLIAVDVVGRAPAAAPRPPAAAPVRPVVGQLPATGMSQLLALGGVLLLTVVGAARLRGRRG